MMAITSQFRPLPQIGEVWVSQWQMAGLLKPSAIKPVIATLEQTLTIRRLGVLDARDQADLRKAMSQVLG